jgi:hypothetical protein
MPISPAKFENWLSRKLVSKIQPPGVFDGDSASYYRTMAEYAVSEKHKISDGDHICLKQSVAGGSFRYTHHGIYLGDGLMVNYSGDVRSFLNRQVLGWVQLTELDTFLGGSTHFTKVQHSAVAAQDRNVVVARVLLNLGRRNYDPAQENCEHFATFCSTGTPQSIQVLDGRSIAFDIAFNMFIAPIIRSFFSYRDFVELEKCKKGPSGSLFRNNEIYSKVDAWMTNGGVRRNLTQIKTYFGLDKPDILIT